MPAAEEPLCRAARKAMARSVALVTGGNSGIGFECARGLARSGWHVLMASRDREASIDAVRRIEESADSSGFRGFGHPPAFPTDPLDQQESLSRNQLRVRMELHLRDLLSES
jgi:NAD(P)-dependent dehydrogenase (short-subunit alcohol dehydrogenase family)